MWLEVLRGLENGNRSGEENHTGFEEDSAVTH